MFIKKAISYPTQATFPNISINQEKYGSRVVYLFAREIIPAEVFKI